MDARIAQRNHRLREVRHGLAHVLYRALGEKVTVAGGESARAAVHAPVRHINKIRSDAGGWNEKPPADRERAIGLG